MRKRTGREKRLLSRVGSAIEERLNPPMDYVGQELSKKIMNSTFILGYPVALVCGIIREDIFVTLYLSLAVSLFGALLTIPSWPIFRRNPVTFYGNKHKED
jgi:signal peptidase complex subunit 1